MYIDRKTLRMNSEEQAAFLMASKWGRMGTVRDGEPHVSPIGFVYLDSVIYFHSLRSARRSQDILHGSRVCLCVDAGVGEGEKYQDRRGVVLYGLCHEIERTDPLLEEVRRLFAVAFFDEPRAEVDRRTHEWFALEPDRAVSWDFSKIPTGTDRSIAE